MSKIVMKHENKEYILEYSRQSVKTMESQGFVLDEISKMPMTMIPLLFQGAFIKNHRGLKRAIIDDLYDEVQDKNGLMSALIEMYAETLTTLTDDNTEGNVTWTVTK